MASESSSHQNCVRGQRILQLKDDRPAHEDREVVPPDDVFQFLSRIQAMRYTIKIARKSFTLVSVGPVKTRLSICSKKA